MTGAPTRLILASASPRRIELLRQIGLSPDEILPADIDETPLKGEAPRDYARRIAVAKADEAAARLAARGDRADWVVLAADTVVACGRRILPKADNATEVKACLGLLSGRSHVVLTAVAGRRADGAARLRLIDTRVTMKRLSRDEVEAYARSGEGVGKAGGYAIQGRAAAFIPRINGSYGAVVGLPLAETVAMITGLGFGPASVSCDATEI